MMKDEYKEKKSTMFIDIGASHTSCFICEYKDVHLVLTCDA